MGINAANTQSYYLEALKNQQPQSNFRLANSYVNTPVFNNNVQQPAVDSFNGKTATPADGKDDGSIGFWGALKNIGKGAVKFFTNMFTDENGDFSLKQTAKTLGMIGLITAATFVPVIGPIVLPALCTWGMIEGGLNVAKGLSGAMSATTDAEAEQAWQQIGSGATEGVLSYTGYKATKGWKGAWEDSTAQYNALKQKYFSEKPIETTTNRTESIAEETQEVKTETEIKAEAEAKAKAEAEAKAKAKEINLEKINKNISYKESHGLKVFADENNFIIRQREYKKSQDIELPVNEKSLNLESEIKSMDAIFDKAIPLENESVVYRGYDLTPYPTRPIDIEYINIMKNAKPGDVITPDTGYTFVGLEKAEIQGNYVSTGVIEIRLPKGTKMVTHDEWEALLPRNASYKVLDKQIADGKVNYIFEYILPEG